MKNKISHIINAFGSKDGLIVSSTIFTVIALIVIFNLLIVENMTNNFIGIFAIFSIVSSIILYKRNTNKVLDK
jgi:hypothetical protein